MWYPAKGVSALKNILILLVLLSLAAALGAEDTRSPYRAMLYSAVFPGGGQLYNRQYLKAGAVLGVQGFLIGSAIYHDGKRDDYRRLAASAADGLQQQEYEALADDYRGRLNNDIWWIGITAALSMIDAYVDAHLYDFDLQKEKLRLRFEETTLLLSYSW
jgi:hypothetical protein